MLVGVAQDDVGVGQARVPDPLADPLDHRDADLQTHHVVLGALRGRISEALDVSTPEVRELEPRIDRALQLLDASLPGRVRVADLATELGLPQRQLSALFREETGLSISTYVLWRRLRTAVSAVAAGASLTEAAYEAGFADAAHLSRTFVRMFGVTPSSSVARSEVVEG